MANKIHDVTVNELRNMYFYNILQDEFNMSIIIRLYTQLGIPSHVICKIVNVPAATAVAYREAKAAATNKVRSRIIEDKSDRILERYVELVMQAPDDHKFIY